MARTIKATHRENFTFGEFALEVFVLEDGRRVFGDDSVWQALVGVEAPPGWPQPGAFVKFVSPDGKKAVGWEPGQFVACVGGLAAEWLKGETTAQLEPVARRALAMCEAFAAIELAREARGNATLH